MRRLLFLFLLVACENERHTAFYADTEFQNPLQEFYRDALVRGYDLPKDNLAIIWKAIDSNCDFPITGVSKKHIAQWYVYINDVYNYDSPEQKVFTKIMVYRELFHVLLNKPYATESLEYAITVNDIVYVNPMYECFSSNLSEQSNIPHVDLNDPEILDYLFKQ